MKQTLAVVYGFATYLFFLVTFLYAIGFVGNLIVPKAIDSGAEPFTWPALIVDLVLLGIFAIQHSVMARPAFKRRWTQFVPWAVERTTFVLASTLVLALLLWQWRPIEGVVWSVQDPTGILVLQVLFFLGWAILLASTFMIDHFDLFGLRQVVTYARGAPLKSPEFNTSWLYRYVRHPIMLGFLIAFWAAPEMSAGHLLFSVATTGYILIGILLEEHDLAAHFGERYRTYRKAVPMLIPLPGRGASSRTTE